MKYLLIYFSTECREVHILTIFSSLNIHLIWLMNSSLLILTAILDLRTNVWFSKWSIEMLIWTFEIWERETHRERKTAISLNKEHCNWTISMQGENILSAYKCRQHVGNYLQKWIPFCNLCQNFWDSLIQKTYCGGYLNSIEQLFPILLSNNEVSNHDKSR